MQIVESVIHGAKILKRKQKRVPDVGNSFTYFLNN